MNKISRLILVNENFIKEFNKNKPNKEFFHRCKKAGALIKIRNREENKSIDKCKYYEICPSCSGWCNNKQPSENCVSFILSAYGNLSNNFETLQEQVNYEYECQKENNDF